ncbi:MAG: hypothetical protein JSS51_06550 [Planctomycetes bacterium]|nr:hypothetical protein [Planctomycetota bacterium]
MKSSLLRTSLGIDLAGAGVLIVLTTVAAAGAIAPVLTARAAHKQLQQQIDDGRADIRQLREQRSDFEQNVARMELELRETRVEVEPVSKLNSRISRLTESASRRKLSLDRVAPETPQKAVKATLVPIRIEGRGTFTDARDWMADLRSEFPDVAIGGFQISRDHAAAAENTTFSFDLVWYAAQSAQTAPKK